jgi:type I restriction enzyme S subunit
MKDELTALNKITDAVLGFKKKPAKNAGKKQEFETSPSTLVKNKAKVETWSIPLQEIYKNGNMRLDASHYDRQTAAALRELKKSGFPLRPLSELATVNLPGQFTRIWAEDEKHGVRYVNASDLMSLTGIGTAEERFLSRETDKDFDELIIKEGWLLLSCSGTIGRVFYASERMDGWVGTHDLIRVIPNEGVPVGFLHAYLCSDVAQKQILGHTHGGQIDHVTHHQVGGILVPILSETDTKEIHEKTMEALKGRERSIHQLQSVAVGFTQTLSVEQKKNV